MVTQASNIDGRNYRKQKPKTHANELDWFPDKLYVVLKCLLFILSYFILFNDWYGSNFEITAFDVSTQNILMILKTRVRQHFHIVS